MSEMRDYARSVRDSALQGEPTNDSNCVCLGFHTRFLRPFFLRDCRLGENGRRIVGLTQRSLPYQRGRIGTELASLQPQRSAAGWSHG